MKIALIGYGKMGKAIEAQAIEKGHEIVLRIAKNNLSDLIEENIRKADAAIEFSRPETALENITFCLKNHVPVVSGTTGWLDHWDAVTALCNEQKGAFFYASNFSIGVNVAFAVNRYLAKLMSGQAGYDVSIEEIHHTQKLDYPSGTAITFAEGVIGEGSQKKEWHSTLEGAESAADEATDSLHILSKRIEGIPGTHHIKWSSPIDEIVVSHTAHTREGFAAGALAAAEWIVGKQGCFEMKDMLGF